MHGWIDRKASDTRIWHGWSTDSLFYFGDSFIVVVVFIGVYNVSIKALFIIYIPLEQIWRGIT